MKLLLLVTFAVLCTVYVVSANQWGQYGGGQQYLPMQYGYGGGYSGGYGGGFGGGYGGSGGGGGFGGLFSIIIFRKTQTLYFVLLLNSNIVLI